MKVRFPAVLPWPRSESIYAGSPEKQKQGKWGSLHEDIVNLILEEAYFDANLRPNFDHFTKYGLALFQQGTAHRSVGMR
jgi:hypothetical protein